MAAAIEGFDSTEGLLTLDGERAVRELTDFVRSLPKFLTALDRYMIASRMFARVLELEHLAPSRQADHAVLENCMSNALVHVVYADPDLALEAGILHRKPGGELARSPESGDRIKEWVEECNAHPTSRATLEFDMLDARGQFLFNAWVALSNGRMVSSKRTSEALRSGVLGAANRRGERLLDQDLTAAALSGDLRLALDGAKNVLDLFIVDAQRRLGLGSRAVRDALPQGKDWKVGPILDTDATTGQKGGPTLLESWPDTRSNKAVERVDLDDELAAASAAFAEHVRERLAKEKPGTARRAVLENSGVLFAGRPTERELATISGHAYSTIANVCAEERIAIKDRLARLRRRA